MSQTPEHMEKYIFKRKPRKCPVCGSTTIAKIQYGMPAFTQELYRDLDEKKVILGGCVIGDAKWGCTECDILFYKEGGEHKFLSSD